MSIGVQGRGLKTVAQTLLEWYVHKVVERMYPKTFPNSLTGSIRKELYSEFVAHVKKLARLSQTENLIEVSLRTPYD